jgi:hypothetical protein
MNPWKIGTSNAVAFSRDGRLLAVLGRDVFVWEVALKSKAVRSHPFAHPSDAAFSPDQRHLAVKSTSGQIVIIDAQSGQTAVDFKNTADGEGSNLQYSSCGEYIVDGSWSGRLAVRRAGSGAREFVQEFGSGIRSVHSSCDGRRWIMIAPLRPTISPFGTGRFGAEDIASCPSVLRSLDRLPSPLTERCWPSSMVRRPTWCRCFGSAMARVSEPCPFRVEAPAILWVGRPMVVSSDQFKIRSSSSTHGQVLERCMSWRWHIPAMWRSRHVAMFWPLVPGKLVGCSVPTRSPRRAFRRNPAGGTATSCR